VTLGAGIGFGIGIAIGIDHKVENIFFQTYMQIPDADSDPDPETLLLLTARRNS